jgi:hypothetical protein
MSAIGRFAVLSLALGLSACAVQAPRSGSPAPVPSPPVSAPAERPAPATTPGAPVTPAAKPMPRTSASFAPPPGGASHWDPKLGVYVLEGLVDTCYRQRTYYRWSGGWSWATSLNGPWQVTDGTGVPAGLGRLHPGD